MWCCARTEKVKRADKICNEDISRKVDEGRSALTVLRRKDTKNNIITILIREYKLFYAD